MTTKATVDQEIVTTQTKIAQTKARVASDKPVLRKAAINDYINDGSAASANPLFASNQETVGAQNQYEQQAEGDLGTAVANLHYRTESVEPQQPSCKAKTARSKRRANSAKSAAAEAQQQESQQNGALYPSQRSNRAR